MQGPKAGAGIVIVVAETCPPLGHPPSVPVPQAVQAAVPVGSKPVSSKRRRLAGGDGGANWLGKEEEEEGEEDAAGDGEADGGEVSKLAERRSG